jgi:hypothetical protein
VDEKRPQWVLAFDVIYGYFLTLTLSVATNSDMTPVQNCSDIYHITHDDTDRHGGGLIRLGHLVLWSLNELSGWEL